MVGIAICAGLAIGVSALIGHTKKIAVNQMAMCTEKGQSRLVIIKEGLAVPASTNARLCDTLTIKNTDAQIRLMAFGVHDNHQPYDGVTEKVLDENQSFTVTLNQPGSFKFHDHLDDSAQGMFTVR